jgi:hypothetical protein
MVPTRQKRTGAGTGAGAEAGIRAWGDSWDLNGIGTSAGTDSVIALLDQIDRLQQALDGGGGRVRPRCQRAPR